MERGRSEYLLRLRLAAAAGGLLALAAFLRWPLSSALPPESASLRLVSVVADAAFLGSAVLGGWLAGRRALAALGSRSVRFEVLVTAAAGGAVALGEFPEAALVLFLFALGETLEAAGVARTRRTISSLLDLVPRVALVRRGGEEREVPVAEVAVGELVVVRPGERLPVDGVVATGSSLVDQAPVTGEAMPVPKAAGDLVFAGTINGSGSLEVVSSRPAEDTTVARVVHLVEEARLEKARLHRVIDRFAAAYTPAVAALALAWAVLPPLVLGLPFEPFVYRALALLLVACPCALVLSTPVAVVAAVGNAARHGVLIKGGAALETAGRIRAVAFDKTGTLTLGRPEVTEVVSAAAVERGGGTPATTGRLGPDETDLLALAAAIEWRSEHPLAQAVRRKAEELGLGRAAPGGDSGGEPAAGATVTAAEARNFEAVPGRGAKARVLGRNHYVGNEALFEADLGVPLEALGEVGRRLEAEGRTVVYVGTSDRVLGLLAVSDALRPEARQAVRDLRQAGVERLYLLTGDNPATAEAVVGALELDGYRAGLLPHEKLAAVRELARAGDGGRGGLLAMVGDGVNDAPALAAAALGLAMGAAGTDQAIEAADVALMGDDLGKVAFTLRLGRRAVAVIRRSIGLALAIKAIALALAAAGLLPLWLAVLADTGNTVVVILNGLRLAGGPADLGPAGGRTGGAPPAEQGARG